MLGTSKSEKVAPSKWYLGDNAADIAWSPDGRHVAVALASGRVKVVDTSADDSICRFDGHKFGAMGVAWSTDGSTIMTAGQDGMARIWEAYTGNLVSTLQGGAQWVEHIACSPDGQYFATTAGKHLKVWTSKGELVYEFKDHRSTISAIQWHSANKDKLVTACYGTIHIFDLEKAQPYDVLKWESSLISLAWSPDGKYIGAGTQDAAIAMWELPSKKGRNFQMTGYETKVRELAWNRDSKFLATAGGRQVTIWNFGGKGPERTTPQVLTHMFKVTQLAYQQNGGLLVSGSKEGHLIFWRPESSKVPVDENKLSADVLLVRWSPDHSAVAAFTSDGHLWLLKAPKVP